MPAGRYAVRYDVYGRVGSRKCHGLWLPCHPAPIQLSGVGHLTAAGSIRMVEFSPNQDIRDTPSADV